jgi:hypothetical protein
VPFVQSHEVLEYILLEPHAAGKRALVDRAQICAKGKREIVITVEAPCFVKFNCCHNWFVILASDVSLGGSLK